MLRSLIPVFVCVLVCMSVSPASPDGRERGGAPTVLTGTKWTNGNVPYRFDPAVTPAQQALFLEAVAELEAVCAVNFFPRTTQTNYVTIRPNPSTTCSANCSQATVGMAGNEQFVNVGSNHWNNRYVLVHELMHTLGFRHEHTRPGCQDPITGQITVLWNNVSQTLCGTGGGSPCNSNFVEQPVAGTSVVGPYDFESIMHYAPTSFSANGQPTIVCNPPFAAFQNVIGNLTYMSAGDAAGLQAEYGAPSAPTITNLIPSGVVLGVPGTTVTINGTRFFEGSPNASGVQGTRVRWNGVVQAVTFVSQTEVQLNVTQSMLNNAGPGCVNIQIENPSPAGGLSNTVSFNIISIAPTPGVFRGVYELEELGHSVSGLRDVDGDGHDEICVGVPGAMNDRGRVTCYSGATGAILWLREGTSSYGSRFGHAIAEVEDINADGVRDLLVGAPNYATSGRAYVVNGLDGTTLRTHTAFAGWTMGISVASVGDVNDDGASDYIVGAPGANGSTGLARVYDAMGGATLFTINGTQSGERCGQAVGGGHDIGGNGVADFVVGSPSYDGANGTESGRVRIYSGQSGALLSTLYGSGAYDDFGWSVTIVPDINGSSRKGDIVVGAIESGSLLGASIGTGYVRVFDGAAGFPQIAHIAGDAVGDRFGGCVRFGGDVDQNGRGDIIIGAWQGGDVTGASGPGYVRLLDSDLSVIAEYTGVQTGERFGWAVAPCGDTDGDGRSELVIGAPLNDATCPGAGEARVYEPVVPPAVGRLLITEVTWGNPDGVELTNFSADVMSLNDWRLHWDDGLSGGIKVAILDGAVLQPGETIIVREPGTLAFSEAFPGTQILYTFPTLTTVSQDITVTLSDRNGNVVDGVRVTDSTGAFANPGRGERFRGLAVRSGSDVSVERIWGLDSNAGADWTAQPQTSMGLESRSSGPRGTDPIPASSLLITEVDRSPDYVEVHNPSGIAQNLQNWYLLAVNGNGPLTQIRPWPGSTLMSGFGFRVVGDFAAAPAEMGWTGGYVNLSAIGGGNIPFTMGSWQLGLYDSYGRAVDVVRAHGVSGPSYSNAPRLPADWTAFTGASPQATTGDGAIARFSTSNDTNTGADWYAASTRSMGSVNQASHLVGNPGHGDVFEVRVGASPNPSGHVTTVFNADVAYAGHTYYFFMSSGHLNGNGPFYGMGPDALTNFMSLGTTPPYTGTLDAQGSARVDLPLALPPGVQVDLLYFLIDPANGQVSANTLVIAFDS